MYVSFTKFTKDFGTRSIVMIIHLNRVLIEHPDLTLGWIVM